jgi:hypothetical protein
MAPTLQSENLDDVLPYRSSERRAGIGKRAIEVAMKEMKEMLEKEEVELLEKSQSLEDAKFASELGWCAAASVAIATAAIIAV